MALTLAQAKKLAAKAQKEKELADQKALEAEALVAQAISDASRDAILDSLRKMSEFAGQVGTLDNELQKEIKSTLRSIVKKSFGPKFRITKVVKVGNKQSVNFTTEEIVTVLKKAKAFDESSGLLKKEIEAINFPLTINAAEAQ